MKHYVEAEMKGLRLALEDKVLLWSDVMTTKMFGCPCYRARGRLFVFMFMEGLVITRLGEKDRKKISRQRHTLPFEAANRKIRHWVRIPMQERRELDKVMPFVRKRYESALKGPKD